MKTHKYQATAEKKILTALIVHDQVLGSAFRDTGGNARHLFKSKWSNLIAGWCFAYYANHRQAPKGIIQDLYGEYAQTEPEDSASIQLVGSFLATLSGEYTKLTEQDNIQWLLEHAADHFDKIRMERMAERMQIALERGDIVRAREAYQDYQRPSFTKSEWVDPFSDEQIDATMKSLETTSLVQFKGALGTFLSPSFTRDGFIVFTGPDKRGKSFWLQEMVWQSIKQRRKVLYYTVGDMSIPQVNRRLYARATGRPWKRDSSDPIIRIPTAIKIHKAKEGEMPSVTCDYHPSDLTAYDMREARAAIRKLDLQIAMKQRPLKLKHAGARALTASGIETDVRQVIEDGFMPDVIIIDYLDLLQAEPDSKRSEVRHQIDATWQILRRISTEYHLLLIGASQSASSAYEKFLIRKGDFSEDKRKNAHVTGMIGINQTEDEKAKQVFRLNWIVCRDSAWTDTQYVWTAGNLALACPCFISLL